MVTMLREAKRADDPADRARHGGGVRSADRITVLVYGRIIASDRPEAIRANEDVRQAYSASFEQVHA